MSVVKTLILGMGNPILTDDSIGCRLAAAVRAALGAGSRSAAAGVAEAAAAAAGESAAGGGGPPNAGPPGEALAKPAAGGARPAIDVIEECSVGGLNLLDVIAGYDRVIALDSIRTRGGTPGDLYRFTAADLRPTQHLSNIHDANFATALELGRRMGMKLPADHEIHVFAVEIVDNETFGEALTATLARQFAELVSQVVDGVREIVSTPVR